MRILVTGGAGFVGSHVSEFYAIKGDEVKVFDNLSRASLLGHETKNAMYNWNYLKKYENIELIAGDIRNFELLGKVAMEVDAIIHTAAQTAITTSMKDPRTDFEVNALGTFNVLEAARLSKNNPCVVFCSTNKVYGDNVNNIEVIEKGKRYEFSEEEFKKGIPESFSIDHCEHTPYGCSKLSGDIYVQDYAHRNEIDAAVFRMSCIYGTRQFGVEDQGWLAWFTIATILGKPIRIFGDGKQVRDVLYVTDLVKAFDAFIQKHEKIRRGVFNVGGGYTNTLSLMELIDLLLEISGKRSKILFDKWRLSDQKVYISDISKIREIGWKIEYSPRQGVKALANWVEENKEIF